MAYFALTTVHGPAWDPSLGIRHQRAWDEHAAFMDGLVEDGFVILGGPIADGERALLMVEAADEAEIEARMVGGSLGFDGALADRERSSPGRSGSTAGTPRPGVPGPPRLGRTTPRGGRLGGGWRRAGSSASSSVVAEAIVRTAFSKAASVLGESGLHAAHLAHELASG